MRLLNVVLYPDSPLREKSEPLEQIDGRIDRWIDAMFQTMSAHDGVGLAAPQVGMSKRLFVCDPPDLEPMVFINPEILASEGAITDEEGCLSLPDIYAPVERAERVHVRAQDRNGDEFEMTADGLLARIIQHETDHLNGVVFLERTNLLAREDMFREWEVMRSRLMADNTRKQA